MSSTVTADFKAYQDRVTSSLVNVTRSAAGISSNDLSFHRSVSDKVSKSLDARNAHLLRLTSKLLRAATKETNIKAPALPDRESVEDNWRQVVDVIDDLLEKADANLDEFNGVIKRLSPAQPATPEPLAARPRNPAFHAVSKPQLHFAKKVDNFETGHWKPLLKSKPHALLSLEESLGSEETGYRHPYIHEIQQYSYPPSVYQEALPIPFTRPENSEPVWVDTEEGMFDMLQELKTAKEVAIDLEHNDRNSYVGLVCLMQISIRNRDWVVDTLQPWRENLHILNQVFADPSIVKVFHGSTSDMIWLQRDLGLYVVGLFDTYHASNVLNYPYKSLAYLLQKFAHFDAQKQYQLADWRVRPLPEELLDYARSDTHYLLYIYDNMRNELVRQSTPDNNLVDYVLENSKKESLQVYERHAYDRDNGLGPEGWLKLLLVRNARTLDRPSFGVFRALHEWRDQKARELDEGVHVVMGNGFLWGCAEAKPQSKWELSHGRVGAKPSYFVLQNAQQVLDVIKRGKQEGMEGPTVQEVMDRNADKLSTFRQFRHVNPHAKPQEVQQSVAATMQKLAQNGELHNGATEHETRTSEPVAGRSTISTLWGSMRPVTTHPLLDLATARAALMSIMPFSNRSDTTISAPDSTQQPDAVLSDVVPSQIINAAPRTVHEPDIDVPFVLKDRKKRHVDEVDAEADLTAGTPSHDATKFAVTDEGAILTQQQARKAFKKARKDAQQNTEAPEYEPFDYANAESVLNAKPEPLSTYKDSRPDKPFNPFAKALDTTTGARRNRLGKELPGKSATFKLP